MTAIVVIVALTDPSLCGSVTTVPTALMAQGCVSAEVAMSVMVEADRQMCLRYYGANGGGESAALSLYPFTTEILTNMRVRRERPRLHYTTVRCMYLVGIEASC